MNFPKAIRYWGVPKAKVMGVRQSHVLLTCEYCGTQKVRLVVNGRGEEKVLMYSQQIPYRPTNPFLAMIFKSRQIWLCHNCVDTLK
jgi:hypothetical protein